MSENKEPKKKKAAPKKKTVSAAKKKEAALKAEIEALKTQRDDFQDRYLRSVAEMDNIRKRQAREIAHVLTTANEKVITDLLPVVDDFERSLKIPNDPEHAEAFRNGVEMITQKLAGVLKKYNVEPMVSVGEPFNVDRHDAMMQVEVEGVEPDMVVEEHERGYLIGEKVLRHAKVLVSK